MLPARHLVLRQHTTTDLQTALCHVSLQDGLSRRQLDIALLLAEQDDVSGLPAFPAALPLSKADGELTGFVLRRVETTCSAHVLTVAEVQERLSLLRVGVFTGC